MKWSALPARVAERLVNLTERVEELARDADQAQARVEFARNVIGGRTDIGPEAFERQRDGFNDTYATAQLLRQKADSARGVLQQCREWVEKLPSRNRLIEVTPAASGFDLATLKTKLAAMRDELRTLNNNPPVASDISKRVDELVANYAKAALPFVRGFAQGQSLDVRWPMDMTADRRTASACAPNNCNPLLMFAAINPAGVANLIMQTVREAQPLSHAQHTERKAELEQLIDEMSYALSAALEKAGELPDPQVAPQHFLGLRFDVAPHAVAAAIMSTVPVHV